MSKLVNELVYIPDLATYGAVETVDNKGKITEVAVLTTTVVDGQIVEEVQIIQVVSLLIRLVSTFDKIIKGLKDFKIKLNLKQVDKREADALAAETKKEARKNRRATRKATRKTKK